MSVCSLLLYSVSETNELCFQLTILLKTSLKYFAIQLEFSTASGANVRKNIYIRIMNGSSTSEKLNLMDCYVHKTSESVICPTSSSFHWVSESGAVCAASTPRQQPSM